MIAEGGGGMTACPAHTAALPLAVQPPVEDVAVAPLLWRLDHYGIELSKTAAPLMKYAERIFSRPAYIEALTPSEKVMRR